jgi:hypothetical protein
LGKNPPKCNFVSDELCRGLRETPPELSRTTRSEHGRSTTLFVWISLKSRAARLSGQSVTPGRASRCGWRLYSHYFQWLSRWSMAVANSGRAIGHQSEETSPLYLRNLVVSKPLGPQGRAAVFVLTANGDSRTGRLIVLTTLKQTKAAGISTYSVTPVNARCPVTWFFR